MDTTIMTITMIPIANIITMAIIIIRSCTCCNINLIFDVQQLLNFYPTSFVFAIACLYLLKNFTGFLNTAMLNQPARRLVYKPVVLFF